MTTEPVPTATAGRRAMVPAAVAALVLALVGAALCAGVAVHEYRYYEDHPFRTGVSGVVAVLGLGAAVGFVAVAVLAWALGRGR